jgi:hypothetical protein
MQKQFKNRREAGEFLATKLQAEAFLNIKRKNNDYEKQGSSCRNWCSSIPAAQLIDD